MGKKICILLKEKGKLYFFQRRKIRKGEKEDEGETEMRGNEVISEGDIEKGRRGGLRRKEGEEIQTAGKLASGFNLP